MKLDLSGPKEPMSRREFLGIRSSRDVRVIIDREKCTGCGLCMVDCPTRALSLSRGGHQDTYQFSFRPDLCDACGHCKRSCPENCLQLEQALEGSDTDSQAGVIFEDKICRCSSCGIPLFPQAMVKNLEAKMFGAGKPTWSFNLCPSCRIKPRIEGKARLKTDRDLAET